MIIFEPGKKTRTSAGSCVQYFGQVYNERPEPEHDYFEPDRDFTLNVTKLLSATVTKKKATLLFVNGTFYLAISRIELA